MIRRLVLLALVATLLAVSSAGASASGTHYVPKAADGFHYSENNELANGTGNYTGYTESSFTNGTIGVASVLANGTENATYSNTNDWRNNQGQTSTTSSSGSFTFSATTFHYVQGTDNQTGYVNPYVWFYMDNTLGAHASFFSLNTGLTVVSTHTSYPLWSEGGKWVATIFAEGNGSFQRNDVYGQFSASYTWKEYYDPGTGYIVGYLYSEHDSDPAGDGFTITDALGVASTTYALTAGVAPPATGGPSLTPLAVGLVAVVALIVVVLIVVGLYLLVRSRRRTNLPSHSRGGPVGYAPPSGPYGAGPPPPMGYGPAPPPLNFDPGPQPAVQQIIVRETVKVACRYCGTLIDSTALVCPKCGAPRT
jgi:hypothetical protein